MVRISEESRSAIIRLRKRGLSHRQIAKRLGIGQGTAVFYSKEIVLTREQHLMLKRENLKKSLINLTPEQRLDASRKGGLNTLSKFGKRTSEEFVIRLIRKFFRNNGRIPFKAEFPHVHAARSYFGSWNNAIAYAGFSPNPVKFSKKHTAKDGHICDSQAERIIDDFLSSRGIKHERNSRYPNTKFTADFRLNGAGVFVEYFGLRNKHLSYDRSMREKLFYVRRSRLKLVSIYPEDLFPKSRLEEIFHPLIKDLGLSP